MTQLNWQSVDQRRDYFTANIMFKSINGIAPVHIRNEISLVSEIHDVNTRLAQNYNAIIPKPNIEHYKKSFKYHGPQIWNALPVELKSAETLDYFKHLYKKEYF